MQNLWLASPGGRTRRPEGALQISRDQDGQVGSVRPTRCLSSARSVTNQIPTLIARISAKPKIASIPTPLFFRPGVGEVIAEFCAPREKYGALNALARPAAHGFLRFVACNSRSVWVNKAVALATPSLILLMISKKATVRNKKGRARSKGPPQSCSILP